MSVAVMLVTCCCCCCYIIVAAVVVVFVSIVSVNAVAQLLEFPPPLSKHSSLLFDSCTECDTVFKSISSPFSVIYRLGFVYKKKHIYCFKLNSTAFYVLLKFKNRRCEQRQLCIILAQEKASLKRLRLHT